MRIALQPNYTGEITVFFSSVITRRFDRLGSSAIVLQLCAGHKLKPLDYLGTDRSEVLLQQLKLFIAYVIERTALLNLALLRQQRHGRREIDLRLSFADASNDVGTVFGEVFMPGLCANCTIFLMSRGRSAS
jgi:hypothetical protein